jgi:hypothetical protein
LERQLATAKQQQQSGLSFDQNSLALPSTLDTLIIDPAGSETFPSQTSVHTLAEAPNFGLDSEPSFWDPFSETDVTTLPGISITDNMSDVMRCEL